MSLFAFARFGRARGRASMLEAHHNHGTTEKNPQDLPIITLLLSLPDWCSSARSCCAEIENRHSRGMVVWEDMSESRAASNEVGLSPER